jgi:hypothetical protein
VLCDGIPFQTITPEDNAGAAVLNWLEMIRRCDHH